MENILFILDYLRSFCTCYKVMYKLESIPTKFSVLPLDKIQQKRSKEFIFKK
jgi:hypothetical protein